MKFVLASLALVGLFVLTPSDRVLKSYSVEYGPPQPTAGIAPLNTVSFEKSGLRIAVEGRLKWLGLPHDLSLFNKDCSEAVDTGLYIEGCR